MKIMNLTVDRLHLVLATAAMIAGVAALALGYMASREKSASEDIVSAAIYSGIIQQQARSFSAERCHAQLWSMSLALPESVRQSYPVLPPLPLPRVAPLNEDTLASTFQRTRGSRAAVFFLAEEIRHFQDEVPRGLKLTAAKSMERNVLDDEMAGWGGQQ